MLDRYSKDFSESLRWVRKMVDEISTSVRLYFVFTFKCVYFESLTHFR